MSDNTRPPNAGISWRWAGGLGAVGVSILFVGWWMSFKGDQGQAEFWKSFIVEVGAFFLLFMFVVLQPRLLRELATRSQPSMYRQLVDAVERGELTPVDDAFAQALGVGSLDSPNEAVLRNAALMLEQAGIHEAAPALSMALAQQSALVRFATAPSLGELEPSMHCRGVSLFFLGLMQLIRTGNRTVIQAVVPEIAIGADVGAIVDAYADCYRGSVDESAPEGRV